MISGFEVVAPKSQFYDPKWDLLGWFSILEQTITSGQLFYWAIYRKSSIKPPPPGGLIFFSSTFEGELNREGGGLKRERGAYLIWRNASTAARFLEDGLVVTGRYTAFSNSKKMVTILHRELEHKESWKVKHMKLEVESGISGIGIWLNLWVSASNELGKPYFSQNLIETGPLPWRWKYHISSFMCWYKRS